MMHAQRRGESLQDAQRRLQTTRKRMDAMLSKLEALESQDTLSKSGHHDAPALCRSTRPPVRPPAVLAAFLGCCACGGHAMRAICEPRRMLTIHHTHAHTHIRT
jgi:hypothetical protein